MHITIGTSHLGTNTRLDNEIRLAKVALLYGDRATLCSMKATHTIAVLPRSGRPTEQQINVLIHTLEEIITRTDNLTPLITRLYIGFRLYRDLSRIKHRTRDQEVKYLQWRKIVLENWPIMQKHTLESTGINELLRAEESGILTLHPLDAAQPLEAIVHSFIEFVLHAVQCEETLPLLDETTGANVARAISCGQLTLTEPDTGRARHVALASTLLEYLPAFEKASLDEIVGIRRDLAEPLTNFRVAVQRFSDGIDPAPWGKGFRSEADRIFRLEVAPAVQEIHESIRDNRYLEELTGTFTKSFGTSAALVGGVTMFVSRLADLPEVLAAGTAASLAIPLLMGWDAYRRWKDATKQISRKQLFFYYKTGAVLSTRHPEASIGTDCETD